MFDLNQVRCFVAVAEELHFGRAARRLNMTQPPLSRQIQNLEHRIGAPLFHRSSRSVQLTPAGRVFLTEARNLLHVAERAALVAQRVASGKAGSIKIGFTAASAYDFVPKLVAVCRKAIPAIDLSLSELISREQIAALLANQLDVGFMRPPIQRDELASLSVAHETLVAAIPARHPLARVKVLALADFQDQDFIMYDAVESRYFCDIVTALFVGAKVQPRFVQRITQIHTMLSLVRAGLGIALVPEAAVNLKLKDVVLRSLALPDPKLVQLCMVWRHDSDNPLVPMLRDVASRLSFESGSNNAS